MKARDHFGDQGVLEGGGGLIGAKLVRRCNMIY